jgi:hypothetical protein
MKITISKSAPLIYKEDDFEILSGCDTGDSRIAYVFNSKNKAVHANLFYSPGSCEVRGLVGKTGILNLVFPLLNPVGDLRPAPKARVILKSILTALKRGEY